MNACGLLNFDLGSCIGGIASNWLFGVPILVWIVLGVVLIGAIWKFAGWPGIVGLAVAVGYALGRHDSKPAEQHPTENGDGEQWDPQPPPAPVHRKTIFDQFRGK